MTEQPDYIVVNRARGKMASPTATEIYVRDFPPVISDEPPSRGGDNRAPSPLEYCWSRSVPAPMSRPRAWRKNFAFNTPISNPTPKVYSIRADAKAKPMCSVHYQAVRLNIQIKTDESRGTAGSAGISGRALLSGRQPDSRRRPGICGQLGAYGLNDPVTYAIRVK